MAVWGITDSKKKVQTGNKTSIPANTKEGCQNYVYS